MNISTSVSPDKKTETEILNFLLNHALENDLPIAFWNLPNTPVKYLIISQEHRVLAKHYPLEDLPAGFMFAPFDREKSALFLPADYLFAFENDSLRSPSTPAEMASAAWLEEKLKLPSASRPMSFKF